jgi:hypothetical protein
MTIVPDPTSQAADAGTTVTAGLHGLSTLSGAGRIAALTALRDAINDRVTWEKKALAESLTGATENQPIRTPFGDISFQPGTRPTKVDEQKLMDYVKTVAPEMVETKTVVTETIPDFYRETLIKDIVHVGDGEFVRASTGEVIEYAYLGEPGNTTISYPASKGQKVAKAAARRVVRDNLERLAAPMLEVTDGRP